MLPRLVLIVAVLICVKAAPNNDWWKNSVIYQIYPRSFRDNNDDGIGDLKGVISKLGHLQDAGVTAAWLSPIFTSPQVDQGYDISNYMDIDEEYGTMADFDEMVTKAHELGIKIIMDFVPNHSSNEHEWFTKSQAREVGYEDFYVWRDGEIPGQPPNNWISNFKDSAWSYSTTRQQWYLHQFAPEQPDLNYRNPEVKQKMQEVIQFWLDKGIDGFRMDAVTFLIEDESFADEPLSGNPNANPGDYEYLDHTLTSDQQGTYDIIYEWRAFIDEYNNNHPEDDPKIMMTEAYTSLENTMKYYTNGTHEGAHFTFNFYFITDLQKSSTAHDFITVIETWINAMPKDHVANWVLGNHDQHRVATRFGPERVDGLNTLVTFLPGVMVTYNGEEIGQENGEVSLAQCQDPRACKMQNEDAYQAVTRDLERTPFHWDDSLNAGFSDGLEPWLPVSEKHTTNNLAAQSVSGVKSHYHVYQDLVKLRQEPGFSEASLRYSAISDNVLAFTKSTEGGKVYVAAINIGDKEETVDLSTLTEVGDHIAINIANSASNKARYSILSSNNIALAPYESFVGLSVGDPDWWKTAVVYQIYPLSFKDSDNSGEGDLQGIISKLGHLKDIGITAVWLSPIFKTGNKDQGYDIIDFRDIDERFGTMADLEMLIEKAHELGIKILLDYVPNHTSSEHEWFTKSVNSESGYENYYVWRGGLLNTPTNWKSIFGGSVWEYSSRRRQRYLHQFLKEQPDLNYREPAVVEAMNDVLIFWLDKGVDGFRMDAVPYLFEDEEFRNEEKKENATGDAWEDYIHTYTSDLDGTFDMIYQWRELIHKYYATNGGDARVFMTEANTDIANTMKYYGSGDRDGAHFTFNFEMVFRLTNESNAVDIVKTINDWLDNMPDKYTANWVLGNHDNHRVATKLGVDNVDGFNMLIGVLPGVMVTYNGEEIGQENGEVNFSDCVDASACGSGVTEVQFRAKSRDFERTPFHWDNTVNAGFNEGAKTWLPVSVKYRLTNAASQNNSNVLSHLYVYKQLLKLRREPAFSGDLEIKALTDNVVGCVRSSAGSDTYIYVFNVGKTAVSVELGSLLPSVTPFVKIVLVDSQSYRKQGDLIGSGSLLLAPHESIIATPTDEEPVVTEKPGGGGGGDGGDYGNALTHSSLVLFIGLMCVLIRN